ncbi:MAG: hypothetical protein WB791_01250 [Waddliaceae bacterium]
MQEFIPLAPVSFFQLSLSCHHLDSAKPFPRIDGRTKRKYLLPDTSDLCDQEPFADVAMGWNEEGIECFFHIDQPAEEVCYPAITEGDSVEVFFDTRDVKTSGYNTRFCHHFFFLPIAFEGIVGKEITHFRTEDKHDLCDPSDLEIKTTLRRDSYVLQAFIPRDCLHGYDTEACDRVGFAYRINRANGEPQHFSVVSEDYRLEQQPSLWSSVRLVK